MKQPLRDLYFKAVADWDKAHRIVGQKSFNDLYQESVEALSAFETQAQTLVDIGAGSGLLGVPWLLSKNDRKAIFIESDIKKASFSTLFLYSAAPELSKRSLVIAKPYQDVSRETVEQFAGEFGYVLCARAFAGSKTLEEVHGLSKFAKEDIFSFQNVQNEKKVTEFRLCLLKKD